MLLQHNLSNINTNLRVQKPLKMESLNKTHLTLMLLSLGDDNEISLAAQCLEGFQLEFNNLFDCADGNLEVSGVDTFGSNAQPRVVWLHINESIAKQNVFALIEKLHASFTSVGILVEKSTTLHATVAKMSQYHNKKSKMKKSGDPNDPTIKPVIGLSKENILGCSPFAQAGDSASFSIQVPVRDIFLCRIGSTNPSDGFYQSCAQISVVQQSPLA